MGLWINNFGSELTKWEYIMSLDILNDSTQKKAAYSVSNGISNDYETNHPYTEDTTNKALEKVWYGKDKWQYI